MKFGFSIYSLWNAMRRGEMTVEEAFAWIAENGGDHIEIIDFGPQETPENWQSYLKNIIFPFLPIASVPCWHRVTKRITKHN